MKSFSTMKRGTRLLAVMAAAALVVAGSVGHWARQAILPDGQGPVAFSVRPGSGAQSAARQIADAGVPVNPHLLVLLAEVTGKGGKLKAGQYELKPGATPLRLLEQLARGEFAQESLTIVEGWTFRQMRTAIDAHPGLRHDTAGWTDKALMARIGKEFSAAEGLFFPDTYRFAKGSSDLQVYKQAHTLMQKRLREAWARRASSLPYTSPYQALTMASIIEKETGRRSERREIAAVFVNRLNRGMRLQTDPTVIYGMGAAYRGNIRKKDLQTDTPYNTYTRHGLPPTPIALPGMESLAAALNPADSDALYFVARGNGTSQFSTNLADHNRAVNRYQRKG